MNNFHLRVTVALSFFFMLGNIAHLHFTQKNIGLMSLAVSNVDHCPNPPRDFDPMSASDSDIRNYGLPKKPADVDSQKTWLQVIQHAKFRSCDSGTPTGDRLQPLGNSGSANWGGYYASSYGLGTSFMSARGFYQVLNCDGSNYYKRETTWVGIGGVNGTNLWQGGIITDSTSDPYYRPVFFYQAFPNGIYAINPQSIAYNCGDEAYSYVDYNFSYPNLSYIYLSDITTGYYWSLRVNFVPDLTSVEWIDERPGCTINGINYPYQLANYHYDFWDGAAASTSGSSFQSINNLPSRSVDIVDDQGNELESTSNLYSSSYGYSGFNTSFIGSGTTPC